MVCPVVVAVAVLEEWEHLLEDLCDLVPIGYLVD